MTQNLPLTPEQLRAAQCRHMTPQERLDDAQIQAQLPAVPQWRHEAGKLRRSFAFANYYETMAFVNALAWVVHRHDHHPELTVVYDRVDVAFDTHSAHGISLNDFIVAAQLDQVYGK